MERKTDGQTERQACKSEQMDRKNNERMNRRTDRQINVTDRKMDRLTGVQKLTYVQTKRLIFKKMDRQEDEQNIKMNKCTDTKINI